MAHLRYYRCRWQGLRHYDYTRMKVILSTLALLVLITAFCDGKTRPAPRNLRQAVRLLDKDCPDSLKDIIRTTEDRGIEKLSYPWGGNYKTISNWISDEPEHSRLVQYLKAKGVEQHQTAVILIAFKRFLLGNKFDETGILQPFQALEAKWASEDSCKYEIDSLRGVYIPRDIEDCFAQINSFWADSTKLKMSNLTEHEFSGRLHHGFGTWMRNNWRLWGGSRLSKYFNDRGIYHPDDMSGIILTSYHRTINGKEIRFNEQVKYYQEYWEKSKIDQEQRMQNEFSKFKLGDTVLYKYKFGFVNRKQEEKYDDDLCIAKGIVIALDSDKFFIKIRLIESCSRTGIVYYDNKDYQIWNSVSRKWEKPKHREIRRMKREQENWFKYDCWEPIP